MNRFLDPLDGTPPTEFVTSRLRLRAIRSGDEELLFRLYTGDSDAVHYMSFPRAGSAQDSKSFVDSVVASFEARAVGNLHFAWIIELQTSNEPMGSVGLSPSKPFALSGGYILNQRFWGKGYASEAWGCLLNWCIAQPRVYRVDALYDVENPASRRVMEKAGMEFEGILRRYSIHPNVSAEPRDVGVCAWARPHTLSL